MFAPPVQRLITELSKLPGIGSRTAQRLAFHILRLEPAEALALMDDVVVGMHTRSGLLPEIQRSTATVSLAPPT